MPPRSSPPATEAQLLETIALAALGVLAALGTVLWLAGEVSGRLFRGGWPAVGASAATGILARFATHAGDPARAWPAPQRTLLPGPAGFYVTLAFLLVPFAATCLALLRRRLRANERGRSAARWASPGDLRPLRVRAPQAGRLTLGRVNGRLLAAEPRQSVVVIGPVQTGKTSGFAVPAILEWQGPVVATSVKSDLMRDTLAARSSLAGAEVWVYDPTGGTGIEGAGWTPLAGAGTWQGAQRVASWLVTAAHHGARGLEGADFWYAAAAKLLAPILHAAALADRTMADVVRWVDTQEQEEVRWGLERAGDDAALTAFDASCLREDRTRSGIYTTAETVLTAYADPGVLASALKSELRAERLLDGGRHTAYLCAPAHEQRRLQPLFATLVEEIVARAYEQSTATGKPLDPPLLIVLDECANIAPLRELATLASTGAGQGIQLVTVFQDMAQISAVYGRDRAPTIVSNHRAKMILSGIADAQTLDYVTRVLGEEEVAQTSLTQSGEGRRSTTSSLARRSLAPANVLRELKQGRGLLLYGNIPPARLALRPFFSDRRLRRLAAGAPK